MSGEVRFTRRGATAVVTIDRPARRNAIDGPTAESLQGALARFEADADLAVLVVTGAGGEAFCAGADLSALDTLAARIDDPGGPLGVTRTVPTKPVIAAIDGWAVAGGLELALWADLRICTPGSRFGCLERRWGVPLIDGGTQRLPRVVGLGRALDLVLTGRVVGAEEALAIGLVTEVVGPGEHLERAVALAETLAAFPRRTMLADRRSLLEGLGRPLVEGLAIEAGLGGGAVAEGLEGARRFMAGEGRGGEL